MSSLPKVTSNDFTEREGIIAVQKAVNAARCVWRELEHRDVGIDGHVEYITPEGFATGRLVAVQVKSGTSWFANGSSSAIGFTPTDKHNQYWAEYPLPIILILHDPISTETVWVDARHQLRTGGRISIPRENIFDADGVHLSLASSGPLPTAAFDTESIVMAMVEPDVQELCFLYLFAQGMTDVGQAIYFGMDLFDEILDVLSATWDPPGFSVSPREYAFLDRYVDFLVAHDLARVDYSHWKQWTDEHGMVASFVVPLTSKGRAVRDAIVRRDRELPPDDDPDAVAIRERFVRMLFNPSGRDEVAQRQRRLFELRAAMAAQRLQ